MGWAPLNHNTQITSLIQKTKKTQKQNKEINLKLHIISRDHDVETLGW